ncbi:MAG: alanine racemase [Ilumatobacteraceae bacterium]
MALRLTVQRAAWHAHIDSIAGMVDGLVPVVKGNGYGFGRATLHPLVKSLSDYVCVGTVYELDSVGERVTPVVLTPSPAPPPSIAATPILTVGSLRNVEALAGWRGRVIVKLQSSMRRYGATPDEMPDLVSAAVAADLDVVGYSLHLPLAGSDADRVLEIEAWLELIDDQQPLWLSHLQPQSYADLRVRRPERQFRLRLGTSLWHGDKSFLHLHTDVAAVQSVRAGEHAGYRQVEVTDDGHLVLVGAGSAHGVAALPDGASPFHFERTRMALLEPPHMHTSMLVAPDDRPCPAVGDRVDVQRPLISALIDEIEWV